MTHIDIVTDERDALGECPLWDERSQSVLWIDSHRQLVRRYKLSTGAGEAW
eukprot:gene23788-44368_t